MSDAKKSAADSITREELEALKDVLDKNLLKYQNYNNDDEHSWARRRPTDPYIGQILHNLNAEHQSDVGGYHENGDKKVDTPPPYRSQTPVIRRKIIRHTVFATPLRGGVNNFDSNNNRMTYGAVQGGDVPGTRIDWSSPFSEYFPILIKDPFQTMMNSFSEIIEYGPAADICRHAAAKNGAGDRMEDANRSDAVGNVPAVRPETLRRSRRNAAADRAEEDAKGVLSHVRPFRPAHTAATTTTTTEWPKMYHWAPEKAAAEHNGDMGPQIKRLVVRRGGVAIAGPGGIATAGSGGTAIVGPGGSAYSSKDSASGATADVPPVSPGVSMAGYGPHVMQAPPGYFAAYQQQQQQQHNGFGRSMMDGGNDGGTAVLSSDGVAYTFPVPSRGLTAADGLGAGTAASQRRRDVHDDGTPRAAVSSVREIVLPDGAKLIATGPIVYYNPEPLSSRKKSRKGKKSSKKRGTNNRKSF